MISGRGGWRDSRWLAVATIALFALTWRYSTFGNPTLHVDDQFYQLVGQNMHRGLLPYVDIWDRKPFGLFLIYYVIAAVSFEPTAYQIAAWLFASATGFVIYLCGRTWASARGSVFAALLYIAALHISGGEGGQAPVFYNLFVAIAALLLLRWLADNPERADRRVWGAMASLGVALTIKQTVMFEAAAMGLFALWHLWNRGAGWKQVIATGVTAISIGIAPTLACFAFFAATGHFDVFWHAMILSNAAKAYPDLQVMGARALLRILQITPLLVPAILSFVALSGPMRQFRPFLLTWTLAALFGFLAVPNFYLHYLLPLWVPIAVLSCRSLDRRVLGPALIVGCISYSALVANPFNRAWTEHSKQEFAATAQLINDMDENETLLVFDGPPAFYEKTGRRFLSPLVFPTHLNWLNERNVSHLDTTEELERILQQYPSVVLTIPQPRSQPANAQAWEMIEEYARAHCEERREAVAPEIYRRWKVIIHARCSADVEQS